VSVFDADDPILMAIVGLGGGRAAGAAIRGGADLIQVRAKALSSRDLLALVKEVVQEVGSAARVIVNGRPDIAEMSGALGVHLPESGLDPGDVRRFFPRLLVGVSRHDREGLIGATQAGAHYAILGPVFPTPGKAARALGVRDFAAAIAGIELPVLAVGGVAPGVCSEVRASGARGVAALRPFLRSDRAAASAEALRRGLDRA